MLSRRCFFACVSRLAFFLACAIGTTRAQDTWEWRSPTPSGNRLVSFAWGHDLWVGVGENGAIATSPDGATWTNRESGVFDSLIRVVFDGTRFIAVGGRTILISSDGTTWSSQTAPANVRDLACDRGLFVAVVDGEQSADVARFLTSSDAAAWTLSPNPTAVSPSHVLVANHIFVAVADDGRVLRSTDARSWTPVTVAPSGTTAGGFGPHSAAGSDVFLVAFAGTPYRSTDGLTWSSGATWSEAHRPEVSGPLRVGYLGNVGFGGGQFYLDEGRHGRGVFSSPDALVWTPVQPVISRNVAAGYYLDLSTLASGNGITVATERSIYVPGGWTNPHRTYLHYASDGALPAATGSSALPFDPASAYTLVYGLGRFFAGGLSSPDATSWDVCDFTPTHAAGARLFSLPVDSYSSDTSISVSSDGLTFTGTTLPMRARSVAFGAGRYVIVGAGGGVVVSTDALHWDAIQSGTTKNLRSVVYAFDRFIAVGTDGALLTSSDGLAWTDRSTTALAGLTLDGLTAGPDRLLVTSSVASEVTPAPVTLPGNVSVIFAVDRDYRTAIYFNDSFIAVTGQGSYLGTPAQLWRSVDGSTWSELPVHLTSQSRRALATGNDLAVLLANLGADINDHVGVGLLTSVTSSPASRAPVVTHAPAAVTIRRGESTKFAVGATGSGPFSYQWFRDGIALVGQTRSILALTLARDSDAGDYTVVVSNTTGSATSAPAHLTIDPPVPLTITHQPIGGKIFDGQTLSLQVAVTGSGPITYQWRRDGAPISRETKSTCTVYGRKTAPAWSVGRYDVVITSPWGSLTSAPTDVIWGGTEFALPVITRAPRSDIVRAGNTGFLAIDVSYSWHYAYQWRRNGVPIPGATSTSLWLHDFSADDAGTYDVVIRSPDFTTTISAAATLSLGWSRLSNLSALGYAGTGEETFFQGFVLSGSTTDAETGPIIRSIGPGLIRFGVENVLADPRLSILDAAHTEVAANDDWSKAPSLRGLPATVSEMSALGASVLDAASHDSALKLPTPSGGLFFVQASGAGSATGYVLNEIYAPDSSTLRLANLSARSRVGDRPLIAGFVIAGNLPQTVLIRGVGPTLARHGVDHPLAHPKITVFDSTGRALFANDRWGTRLDQTIIVDSNMMDRAGAFRLDEGSNDAALFETLAPGVYSVHVTSADSTSGIALVEIYAVP